jgi:hypothetical protein
MNLETQTNAVLFSDPSEPQTGSDTSAFASLEQAAALEFHATMQLLAERGRFLTGATGVAVALEQEGQFVYSAAAGSLVPNLGATADVTKYPLRKCVKTGEAVRLPIEASSLGANIPLAVGVLKDEKVVAFFELAPGPHAFEDADVEAVSRLSDMVSTALDHLQAAKHSARLIGETSPEEPAVPAGPVLWHAPETAAAESAPEKNPQAHGPADVRACTACGFPVSGVRTLCVDCESRRDDPKNDPQHDPTPPAELFALGKGESWISAHGYTIASVLVSALAVAIIYWLR